MWIMFVAVLAMLIMTTNIAYAEDGVQMSTVAQRANGDVVVDHVSNGISGYVVRLDEGVKVHSVPFALPQYKDNVLSAIDLLRIAEGELHSFTLFSADQTTLEFLRLDDDDGNLVSVRVGRFILGNIEPCGDLNDDGLVDVNDAIISLQIIVGKVKVTEAQAILGDVVPDGVINVLDAILVLKSIVGKHTFTGCGLGASGMQGDAKKEREYIDTLDHRIIKARK